MPIKIGALLVYTETMYCFRFSLSHLFSDICRSLELAYHCNTLILCPYIMATYCNGTPNQGFYRYTKTNSSEETQWLAQQDRSAEVDNTGCLFQHSSADFHCSGLQMTMQPNSVLRASDDDPTESSGKNTWTFDVNDFKWSNCLRISNFAFGKYKILVSPLD